MNLKGSCLCGEIQFEVSGSIDEFSHCYCKRCRKATGSGHSSVLIISPDQLRWKKGVEKLQRYDLPSALSFASSFCSNCGSNLPRLTRDGLHAVVPAGPIDDEIPIGPQFHEYYGYRAPWVQQGDLHLPVYEGAAVPGITQD